MSHVQRCLDEVVAEISSRLESDVAASALEAIEERLAGGEKIGLELETQRKRLEGELLCNPYVKALETIGEVRRLLAAAEAGVTTIHIGVTDLAERRVAAATSAPAARKSWRTIGGTAVAASLVVAALAFIPALATGAPGLADKSAIVSCAAQF
jgi:hypothetical protein